MQHLHEKTVITAKSLGGGNQKTQLKSRRSFQDRSNVAREVSGPELAAF